jgi:hypothetical protein
VEQGIAVHDPQRHRSLAFVYGFDPKSDHRTLVHSSSKL